MNEQDRSQKKIFEEEQAHLTETHRKLREMRGALEAKVEAISEKAAREKEDIRSNLSLNFDSDTDSMETYIEFEAMSHSIDQYNIEQNAAMEKLGRVKRLLKAPYFARVRLRFDPEEEPEDYYIGSAGVSENAWQQLVIDWRGGAGLEMALPYTVDLTDFSLSYDFGFEDMDASRQYWANIFISDFIEQYKSSFPTDNGSDFELASFAHLFCKINRHDALRFDGNYDTFSLDTVNELCLRFFGREIHPNDGVLYESPWGLQWTYQNGLFRFPSGDGESYNRFAIVKSYLRLAGGNVILGYDVYELDLDEYWRNGIDGAFYRMTSAQAQAAEASGRITRVGSGWAEATPVEQNGRDGYYLRRMQTMPD